MNGLARSRLRRARNLVVYVDYIFELGKGRINIINTVLLVLTMVKVYEMSEFVTYMFVAFLLFVIFIMGIFMDYIKIPHRMAVEKEKRSPFMQSVMKNQKIILDKITNLERQK